MTRAARWLLVLALLIALPARADTTAQTIVHMLDYMSVDYPEFVKDGKVLDEGEYKEQQEFSAQVIELLGKLPDVVQRAELLRGATLLQARIEEKAPGPEVSKLASDLRWKVIGAYKIAVAPRTAPDLKRGESLYAAHCMACHGEQGRGDGPAAKGLDPPPSNFHDAERMAQRSLYGLYNTVTLGVAGTSMQAYPQLSDDERWALAFYVGSLRDGGTARNAAIAYSRRMLAESLAAYRAGKRDEAQRFALSAYLEGFELAEASLDAVDRNLRQEVETQMINYRDALRRGVPAEEIAKLAARIDDLLEAAAGKLGTEGLSPTTAAFSAFFILLREGLEALLVVAAIVAFLTKAGRREALPWIHAGWIGALVLGGLTWFAATALISISGATRELTEGVTALLAAAILLYVGFWLHDKSHARNWQRFIDRHMKDALQKGTLWAFAGLSFLAVYREAFETVLFYQALWQQAGEGAHGSILVGFGAAVAVLALLAWLILRYGVRLPIGLFFAVCAVLMAGLAVVFTGHGVKALQEAGVFAASPTGSFGLPALGIYPTVESLTAQVIVLALVLGTYFVMRKEPQ